MNQLTDEGIKLLGNLGNLGIPYDSIGIRLRSSDREKYLDVDVLFYRAGTHVASITRCDVHQDSDLFVTGIAGNLEVMLPMPPAVAAQFSRFPDPE